MRRCRANVFESIPLTIWKAKLSRSILSYHKSTAESVQYILGFLVVVLVEKLVCTGFQIPLSNTVFILFMSGTEGRKRQKVGLAYKVYSTKDSSFFLASKTIDGWECAESALPYPTLEKKIFLKIISLLLASDCRSHFA